MARESDRAVMSLYFNEIEEYPAQWLRNLYPGATIAHKDIADVTKEEVSGFTRSHFFAGIAGWELALELAEWPRDRVVWTGSCPCQPFSVAGKGKGKKDKRHLWPEFYRLIKECRPDTVFGEQVASKLGRSWLAGVRDDLEALGYAFGAVDISAASVGAPHIRQRLYWVASLSGHWGLADTDGGKSCDRGVQRGGEYGFVEKDSSFTQGLADTTREYGDGAGNAGSRGRYESTDSGATSGLEISRRESERRGLPGPGEGIGAAPVESSSESERPGGIGGSHPIGTPIGMGESTGEGLQEWARVAGDYREKLQAAVRAGRAISGVGDAIGAGDEDDRPGGAHSTTRETEGEVRESGAGGEYERQRIWSNPWQPSDLVYCLDGKFRRVKPGVRVLVNGIQRRVSKLRALGNAIVPQLAAEFIRSYMEAEENYHEIHQHD